MTDLSDYVGPTAVEALRSEYGDEIIPVIETVAEAAATKATQAVSTHFTQHFSNDQARQQELAVAAINRSMYEAYGDEWEVAKPLIQQKLDEDPSLISGSLSPNEALQRFDTLFKSVKADYDLGGTRVLRDHEDWERIKRNQQVSYADLRARGAIDVPSGKSTEV